MKEKVILNKAWRTLHTESGVRVQEGAYLRRLPRRSREVKSQEAPTATGTQVIEPSRVTSTALLQISLLTPRNVVQQKWQSPVEIKRKELLLKDKAICTLVITRSRGF